MSDSPAEGPRDGKTFSYDLDYDRLNTQMDRVWAVVKDFHWHTLRDIAEQTGDPEASISARLRDLRKPRFGGHCIETERVPSMGRSGLWRVRLVAKPLSGPTFQMMFEFCSLMLMTHFK